MFELTPERYLSVTEVLRVGRVIINGNVTQLREAHCFKSHRWETARAFEELAQVSMFRVWDAKRVTGVGAREREEVVFISYNCRNKVLQTWWLKNHRHLFSHNFRDWKSKSRYQQGRRL